ncbi:MAG: glucosyltransferase domain-containing protein [Lachnospiraceae bacterium]|nr:glucosyltransferase domain-containing protein [Lachnospiraceae bacterium]
MRFDLFAALNKKIPGYTRICFITGLIAGWITHFYMLSHKLVNWDDANNMSAYGSGDYLGRWFLKYIHPLGGVHSIPAVHGMLFILLLAVSACLILEITGIRSVTGAILVPTVLLTFPSVASTMTFMFMAHTSGIGIFMVCLGVYLMRRYRYGSILCGVLLLLTLGTYQSYISFAITLMLMGMINDLINHEKGFKEVLREGIICVIVLGVSVALYMWLSHVIYPNLDNETYGGVGNMGQIAPAQMPVLIARCYKRFLEFFIWKPFAFMTGTKQAANICVCVLAVILFAALVIKKKIYRDAWRFVLLLAVCGFVPLAAAFIYFMAPEADYSMLMLYSYALIYVLVLALLEYCLKEWGSALLMSVAGKRACCALTIAVTASVSVSCYADYLVTNKAYLRTELATERVSSYFNRIIAFAESAEGFDESDGLVILGEFYYKDNPSSVELDVLDSEGLRSLDGVALENGLITSGVRDNFIRLFVGYETAHLSDAEKEEIMNTEEYKAMSVYPSQGSVCKINGVWVVKLTD